MARLRRLDVTQRLIHLPSDCTIGRSSSCELMLTQPEVSSRQAAIRYAARWILQDLASRNGTFYNGRRLNASETVHLAVDDVISFATPEAGWRVLCVKEPQPMVMDVEAPHLGFRTLCPVDDHVAADDCELPVRGLCRQEDRWYVTHADGGTEELEEGRLLELDGHRYQVALAAPVPETVTQPLEDVGSSQIEAGRYELAVSRNEEQASLNATIAGRQFLLQNKVCLCLLARLAALRIKHVGEGCSEKNAGWIDTPEAIKSFGYAGPEQLTLDVHRARECFRQIGVANPNQIIARRRGSLRVGVPSHRLLVNAWS